MKYVSILVLLLSSFSVISQNGLDDQFAKYEIQQLDAESFLTLVKTAKNGPSIINLMDETIEFIPSNIISATYQTITSDGKITLKQPDFIPLRGYTASGEAASLTIGPDFIYGFITKNNIKYFIEPASTFDATLNTGSYILYSEKDVKNDKEKTCAATELNQNKTNNNPNKSSVTGLCYEVQYAICNDYSMLVKYGSQSAVEGHAIGVTNNMNNLYDDEFLDEIKFIIQGQYHSTCPTCDPWTNSTASGTLLADFRNWCQANLTIPHDDASLWTNRDFDGSTIGIAYVGAVCSSFKYNCLQDWSSNAALKQVMVSHELGHNFGANHDASSGFIMSSSVGITTTWSGASQTAVQNYYNSISCLSSCVSGTPVIQFSSVTSAISEEGGTGTTGACNEAFKIYNLSVSLIGNPTNNINASITTDNSSTAIVDKDYSIINSTITFTPSGSVIQNFQIRIIDDAVDEINETLKFNLVINSGNATLGSNTTHTITITDEKDEVSSICCSGGGTITYGNYNYIASTVFNGTLSDQKTRVLVLASELTQSGLTAGFINSLSLSVVTKGSSGAFQNFRIGMTSTSATTLTSLTWLPTTETFIGSVNTILSWNDFAFTTPYFWDGTSNLYIQFCYNNTTVVGADEMEHTIPLVATGNMLQYQQANNTDGCSSSNIGGTASFNLPIQPRMKLGVSGGALVEITQGLTANTNLKIGETAHFYSSNDKVIASVKNIGTVDMGCTSATIQTAGNSRLTSGFGSGFYTQKTFRIITNTAAEYELTLYYLNSELTIWGAQNLSLNMIGSSQPLASSIASQVEIIAPSLVSSNVGSGSQISYKGTFSGKEYYGLTDVVGEITYGDFGNVDFVFDQTSRGLLLKNSNGTSYRITVNSIGTLTTTSTTGVPTSGFEAGDMFLSSLSKGVIFKRATGLYTKVTVSNTGTLVTSNISSLPSTRIVLGTGDFELEENGKGVILKAPNGSCYRIFVNLSGVLSTQSIGCP